VLLLLIDNVGKQITYLITVFSQSPTVVLDELRQLLGDSPGLRVRRIGPRFFIEGGVRDEAEAARVQKIAKLYPGQVESLVTVGAGSAAGDTVNIRVDFYFIEYRKTDGFQAGVGWPSRIGGPGTVTTGIDFDLMSGLNPVTATASIVDQPLPFIDLLAQGGYGKVLKHSTVMTINGNPARFLSGGKQNYITSGLNGGSITAIRYGIDLNVVPRLNPHTGDIELDVKTDIAELMPPAYGDLPAVSDSKLETLVRMRLGQAFVLSGVSTETYQRTRSGLPLLSEIPILGFLFGRQTAAREEVEGALLVIPSALESVPVAAEKMVAEAVRQFKVYDGDMKDLALPGREQPASWKTAPTVGGKQPKP
jgi:pilus assembly protein CpaC